MNKSWQISRRTVLRGLGTAVALPMLDCMLPAAALAAGGKGGGAPNRMAFLYVPNGMHMPAWKPAAVGEGFELPSTLQPLAAVKDQLMVLSGLAHDKARANGDGPGDHARALACFLTGCQPRKTHGADIEVGVSVDQVAAQKIGNATRLPSLELGCDAGSQTGNCDSGYSCAYSANTSWKTPTTPMAKEVNPRLVFERLFADSSLPGADEGKHQRQRNRQSVLDFVLDDASRLKSRLGATDQRKLDEYLTSVRELEERIGRVEQGSSPAEGGPALEKPAGIPDDYAEHIRLMGDLIVLAFQQDLTRIVTFVLANEGSNRSYAFIDVPEGHHDLSHHGRDEAKQAKIARINHFHVSQLAYLLEKMKATPEGDGTLLDHSMVVYGSAIGDGNRHNHDDLPILLAGRGCGTLKPGRHIEYPDETPLNNLWLSMLDRVGAPTDELGDATGRLENLA